MIRPGPTPSLTHVEFYFYFFFITALPISIVLSFMSASMIYFLTVLSNVLEKSTKTFDLHLV
jgi:hypothetical protein